MFRHDQACSDFPKAGGVGVRDMQKEVVVWGPILKLELGLRVHTIVQGFLYKDWCTSPVYRSPSAQAYTLCYITLFAILLFTYLMKKPSDLLLTFLPITLFTITRKIPVLLI
jgi:hypothetical protein